MENDNLDSVFAEGVSLLGLAATETRLRRISLFRKELEFWNPKSGLVNATGEDLIVQHFLDSLAAVPFLPSSTTVADVGSGGGFPGIPLAIFLEDREFVLIERSGKRAAFLRSAIAAAGLANVRVAEEDASEHPVRYDLVVFRALGELGGMYPVLAGLCSAGGKLAAYKGTEEQARKDCMALPGGVEWDLNGLAVPFSDRERHLLTIVPGREG